MKPKKIFEAERGVLMDAYFTSHQGYCAACQRFNPSKPATAALMCLEGAAPWKRDNTKAPKREPVQRSEFFATKGQMKALTRYKGD